MDVLWGVIWLFMGVFLVVFGCIAIIHLLISVHTIGLVSWDFICIFLDKCIFPLAFIRKDDNVNISIIVAYGLG